jgi:hypothetical protein
MAVGRRASRAAALGLLALLPCGAARASGVDGAGRRVVIPLAFMGGPRESIITITNPNPVPLTVRSTYFGAEDTAKAASTSGKIDCRPQTVPANGSATVLLKNLCLDDPPVEENFGYVVLVVDMDTEPNMFVTTTVESMGVSTGIDAQPWADHDPGFAPQATLGLEVGGVRRRASQEEWPVCFVGTLGEPKKFTLSLLDRGGAPLGTPAVLSMDADRMVRVDLEKQFVLAPADEDDLRVTFSSAEPGLLIAGCGAENKSTKSIGFQLAQTPEPADRSRLHDVVVHVETNPGPYFVPYPWSHTLLHDTLDRKVVLSTYVRPDDELHCWLEAWVGASPPYDTSPYLELRVLDPKFNVIAGGSRVKDTGPFRTPSRGHLPSAAGDRHLIEVSYDEDASWPHLPSFIPPTGAWQVHCTSAAGMSEPIPVPVLYLDDF